MNTDWFEDDCPLCQQLKKDIEGGLAEEVEWSFESEIDEASNHVLDLLELGRIDEAEAKARELLKNYPDQVDGLDRLAMVHEARGEHAKAIQYYESAIAFTHAHEGFEEGAREYYREQISELRKKLP